MKSVLFAFLTAASIPFPLSAATAGSGAPTPSAEKGDASDFTSLRAKAERGNAVAQYNLGIAYAEGRQTPVNVVEAFVWLTLAAEGGSTGRAIETVLDKLSAEQLAAARRRLELLRASNPNLRPTAVVTASKAAPAAATPVPIIAAPARSTAPSAPVIAVPSSSEEPKQIQNAVAAANADKQQLATELQTAWKEIEQLQSQLAARKGSTNELAAAQALTREAQATLAKQSTELAASRADASAARTELAGVLSQLNAARQTLATNTAAASVASDAATALERERTAHAATQATLAQLKTQVNDLTSGRATLERDAVARAAAAERAQASASDEARKWTTEKAELSGKTDTLARELKDARAELATIRETLAGANAKSASAEAQSRQVAALEKKLATTHDELNAAKTALATATSQAQSAESRAQLGAQAESQLTPLRNQVGTLERELQTATAASKRVAADKAAAETALNDTNQKLADATKELTSLRQRAAETGRQLSAGADQKVAGLQAELNDTKSRLTAAEKGVATRDEEMAKLRAAVAAAESRPTASPTDLETARRATNEAQQRLAGMTQEVAALRNQAAAARDLEARVRQLEAEKAGASSRPGDSSISKEEFGRVVAAQADAENKLSTALRAYTVLTRERDELRTRVADLSAKISTTSEALTTVEAQAKAASASASAAVASSAELEALRIRTASAERSAEAAQVDLEHANQLLTAFRPSASQPTRPTVAPGQPARTHTIAVGETLSGISLRYYGSATRWPEILTANRDVLPDDHSFIAGRTLRIP